MAMAAMVLVVRPRRSANNPAPRLPMAPGSTTAKVAMLAMRPARKASSMAC
jgi:hypothetical protein